MTKRISRRGRVRSAVGLGLASMALMVAAFGSPAAAQAESTPYCGGWLGAGGICAGGARTFFELKGEGAQHSVCVYASENGFGQGNVGGVKCSSGPGAAVFNSGMGTGNYFPVIYNNAVGENLVHGTAFGP
jgi:hypothetical protein